MIDTKALAAMPFHFWSLVFFVFGSVVGSFLNVCIHRLPRGESVVTPRSHCPHCNYEIPWFLNIPIVTWLYLRGRCANCGARFSFRYFVVELLTATGFLGCWLGFGSQSAALALVYCVLLAGFIAATLIDYEHFIIPDQITLGGIAAGFLCSFVVPALHGAEAITTALERSALGIAVGGGLVYGILRLAKLMFGRQKLVLDPDTKIVFGETALQLPDQEIPYEDLFYRQSDTIALHAKLVQMGDRSIENVPFRLTQDLLRIGEETFKPEEVTHLEVVTDRIILPREAMGLGDVKFMAAIGSFLGWKGVLFSLMVSSVLGGVVGLLLIVLGKKEWSSRIPYGPYIALAATIWIFFGVQLVDWWLGI